VSRRIRIVAALAAVTAVMACTAATSPPAPPSSRPAVTARAAAIVQPPRPVAGIGLTAAVQPIPTSSRHSAFPSIAQAPSGELVMVWRGDYDHEASRTGQIYRAVSRDQGVTWSGERVVSLPGGDKRDPSLSFIAGHEYLTYFTGSASNSAEGAFVSRDGGAPVRIDALPYAAISAPVVLLPDGRLGTAFYAKKPGESLVTAWMAWSSDLGASWTTNRIINSGLDTAEPWLVVDGATVHMFARWGSSAIAVRDSADSGRTFPAAPRVVVTDCTGRPTTYRTTAGTLVMICRGPLSQGKHAKVVFSLDHAASWNVGPTVLAAPAGPIGMTYAAMIEPRPGVIVTVVGMEQADGSSALYGGTLAEVVS
jgi:hypothetical protein